MYTTHKIIWRSLMPLCHHPWATEHQMWPFSPLVLLCTNLYAHIFLSLLLLLPPHQLLLAPNIWWNRCVSDPVHHESPLCGRVSTTCLLMLQQQMAPVRCTTSLWSLPHGRIPHDCCLPLCSFYLPLHSYEEKNMPLWSANSMACEQSWLLQTAHCWTEVCSQLLLPATPHSELMLGNAILRYTSFCSDVKH